MGDQSLVLRQIPKEERPRERLLHYGAEALSNSELLAILLRTGTANESAVKLAGKVLAACGGLRHLTDMTVEQLTAIKGIGLAKALQLKAGIELGRRLSRSRLEDAPAVRSPREAAELVHDELRYLTKEHFIVLFLNTKNRVIGKETMSIGSLNASIVHPREVFRSAIRRNSASIICAHNHPSGDPTPSPEDIEVTRRLSEAGKLIGIELLDHIIIADQAHVSLKELGYL
jgi:DNA repair protein RadC